MDKASQGMSRKLALTNIRILDSNRSAFSAITDLVVTGKIVSGIGTIDSVLDEACSVIDCHGRYAIPGLWECHAHLLDLCAERASTRSLILTNQNLPVDTDWDSFIQDQLSAFLRNGVTHIRDVGGPLEGLKSLVESIKNGLRTGPDIRFAGPMLEKPPLHWVSKNKRYPGFSVPVETRLDADIILDQCKRDGAGFVKTFNKFDPDVFSYLAGRARELQLPVTHDPGDALFQWIPIDFAMEHGIGCFEHAHAAVPVVLRDKWRNELEEYRCLPHESDRKKLFFRKLMMEVDEAVDPDRLNHLCRMMVDRDICICPTLFAFQPLRTKFEHGPPNDREAARRKINEAFCYLLHLIVATLAANHVKILVGHDSSMPGGTALEMGYLQEWGMKPASIIKGATLYPAQWFGADDLYGSIEVNKMADLVVLDDDPLMDISRVRSPWAVCHQGNWIPCSS